MTCRQQQAAYMKHVMREEASKKDTIARDGFLDAIGIVTDQHFRATKTPEDDAIAAMDLRMPSDLMKERYERHRMRLLFTSFKRVEGRRV